jgi:hypothetical protein
MPKIINGDEEIITDATELIKSGLIDIETRNKRIGICESCDDYLPIWIGGEYNQEHKILWYLDPKSDL